MNRRKAKAWACHITAALIQQYLDAGQPWSDCADSARTGWRPEDAQSLADAFATLRNEMERRSDSLTD